MASCDERSNKGMKLTSAKHIERSQLIPGVVRTSLERSGGQTEIPRREAERLVLI
jgi:hypothetical protein